MSVTVDTVGQQSMVAGLAAVGDAMTAVLAVPSWSLSEAELPDAVLRAGRELARMTAVFTGLVGEMDARQLTQQQGACSTVAWLRHRLCTSGAEASSVVRIARAVRTDCAATGAALAAGEITLSHAAVVTRAVTELPAEVDEPTRRAAEATRITESARFDPPTVATLGRRILQLVAPWLWDRIEADRMSRFDADAARCRELTLSSDGHGLVWLRGRLDTEAAATVQAALDPLSAPLPQTAEGPDRRTAAHRRGDAIVELCRRALAAGDLPDCGSERPTVVVTMDWDRLREATGVGVTDDGVILSPDAVRRTACDATIFPSVLNGDGLSPWTSAAGNDCSPERSAVR